MIQKLSKNNVKFKYNMDVQVALTPVQRALKDRQAQYRSKLLLNMTKLLSLWIRHAYPGCPFSAQPTIIKENYKMFIDVYLFHMKDIYYRPHGDYAEPEDIRCIDFFKKMMDSRLRDIVVFAVLHSFSSRHSRVQAVASAAIDVTKHFENIGKERLIERFRKYVVVGIYKSLLANITYYGQHAAKYPNSCRLLRMNYLCFKNDIPTINVVHSEAILNQQWLIFARRYDYLFDIPTT
jgi:hypothetical protein